MEVLGGIFETGKVILMKRTFQNITIINLFLFIIFWVITLFFPNELFLTLSITFGTIFYHLGMRLLVGFVVDRIMNNKADYTKKWYQVGKTEAKLYKFLNVKKWKGNMPTYDPEVFSLEKHTWDEIAQAMCQAEVVHEINCVISFLPILAASVFGALPVFIITSVLACLYDLLFVMIQRYNRPRIVRMIKR